jgi:hypothetical protein
VSQLNKGVIIFLVTVLSASVFSVWSLMNQSLQVDDSWVAEVESYLELAKPYPTTISEPTILFN